MREDTPYAHHPAMRRPWQQYWGEQRQREVVSKPFLDFEAEAPDGTKHHLSDYAGRGQYRGGKREERGGVLERREHIAGLHFEVGLRDFRK